MSKGVLSRRSLRDNRKLGMGRGAVFVMSDWTVVPCIWGKDIEGISSEGIRNIMLMVPIRVDSLRAMMRWIGLIPGSCQIIWT